MSKAPKKPKKINLDMEDDESDLVVEEKEEKQLDISGNFMKWGNSSMGEGTLYIASSQERIDAPRIPTGIFALDYGIGGGIPIGEISAFEGPEAGGKTSAALSAIARMQKLCMRCFNYAYFCKCKEGPLQQYAMYIALERGMDYQWAKALGVDLDKLIVAEPESGEEAGNILYKAMQAYNCGLIVADSAAAFVPESDFADKAIYSQQPGTKSKLITKIIENTNIRLTREMKKRHNIAVIFTNQIRDQIGVLYGSNELNPCGHAFKHYASLRLRLSRLSLGSDKSNRYVVDDMELIAKHSFKVVKAKMLRFQGKGEYLRAVADLPDLDLKKGQLKDHNTLMKLARQYGVVTGEGPYSMLSIKADTLDQLKQLWRAKPDFYYGAQQAVFKAKREELCNQGDVECPGKDVPSVTEPKSSPEKTI